jgi:hypothetical protein
MCSAHRSDLLAILLGLQDISSASTSVRHLCCCAEVILPAVGYSIQFNEVSRIVKCSLSVVKQEMVVKESRLQVGQPSHNIVPMARGTRRPGLIATWGRLVQTVIDSCPEVGDLGFWRVTCLATIRHFHSVFRAGPSKQLACCQWHQVLQEFVSDEISNH